MLAVFSLPLGVSALNLRHERHQLRQIIRAIAADSGFSLDLRVLQYGVTREALKKMLAEGDGWDILHFSGHGLASELILEKEDGSPDFVSTPDLLELLRPARGRLRWVTLSSCLSAAATAAETLRWLGLEPHRQQSDLAGQADEPADDTARMPVLASALADHLDCAVLAMRFPVGDQFAIDLGRSQRRAVSRHGRGGKDDLCGGTGLATRRRAAVSSLRLVQGPRRGQGHRPRADRFRRRHGTAAATQFQDGTPGAAHPTATRLNNKAQGRAAHPGLTVDNAGKPRRGFTGENALGIRV